MAAMAVKNNSNDAIHGTQRDPANEEGPTSAAHTGTADGGNFSTFQWLLAWVVLAVVTLLLIRTRIGYLLAYYALALSILFLVVTQYQWFASVLAPFSALAPGLTVNTTGGSEPGTSPHE